MIPMNRADPGKRSGASFWLEVLLPAVREQVLYPAMEAIHRKYATEGGVHIVVQTTGDLLTWSLIDALVARHVSCLLISGVDSFHKGLETKAAQLGFVTRLTMLLETRGYGSSRSKTPGVAISRHRGGRPTCFSARNRTCGLESSGRAGAPW